MGDINLADAKARLSELVERAAAGEPVRILRRGKPVAQIVGVSKAKKRVSATALQELTSKLPKQKVGARKFVRAMREGARY
jgi:prevent-host-death family protein